ARAVGLLVPRARSDPEADRDRAHVCKPLRDDALPGVELAEDVLLHCADRTWAVSPSSGGCPAPIFRSDLATVAVEATHEFKAPHRAIRRELEASSREAIYLSEVV